MLATLLAAGVFGLNELSTGHGGTYRGPGDTVPPGGGGGGGGGGGPSSGPTGGSGPGPGGTTPSPGGPAIPGNGSGAGPVTGLGGGVTDLTLWQFWWGFNKDPYLNLKGHIHEGSVQTGSDDYFLGRGQQPQGKDSLAPSELVIRGTIVPALIEALTSETNNDIVTGAMMALAKIGDEKSEDGSSPFEQLFLPFLKAGEQEIAETAVVALGVLGNDKSIETLTHLLRDDEVGRKLVGKESRVNSRTRAFAAYGLGQLGYHTDSLDRRMGIVESLWEICESPRGSTRDLKVAAVIAMGLVPLDVAGRATFDERENSLPPQNRSEQIDYLLTFFLDEKSGDKHFLVRSHAPRSIVKLMEGLSDEDNVIKNRVVKALAPFVSKRGNVGVRELRQSVSLAFGGLGDLDNDEADVTIRTGLIAASSNADMQVKNFSVIALGQVGGRPGSGADSLAGVAEVRKYLMLQLAKGKTQMRPWAGLALGVLERGMMEAGEQQSSDVLLALRESLRSTKTKIEVGAYSIACGIAGDSDAEGILLEKFDRMSDDDVRGYTAIGLGLMNATSAIEPIQEVVRKSKYRGELLKQTAIALGLLGDKKIVTNLTEMLVDARTLTTQAALASALGFIGDSHSVEPLIQMLHDDSITDRARGFAAASLGIVADKEKLPFNTKFSVDINYRANTSTLTGEGTGLLDIL
ncbi:MAG: HEAT repeat protein [Planctomycetota bacterium]|jgi:HEAT repeat protein